MEKQLSTRHLTDMLTGVASWLRGRGSKLRAQGTGVVVEGRAPGRSSEEDARMDEGEGRPGYRGSGGGARPGVLL